MCVNRLNLVNFEYLLSKFLLWSIGGFSCLVEWCGGYCLVFFLSEKFLCLLIVLFKLDKNLL